MQGMIEQSNNYTEISSLVVDSSVPLATPNTNLRSYLFGEGFYTSL